jgi:hypothetical protein
MALLRNGTLKGKAGDHTRWDRQARLSYGKAGLSVLRISVRNNIRDLSGTGTALEVIDADLAMMHRPAQDDIGGG